MNEEEERCSELLASIFAYFCEMLQVYDKKGRKTMDFRILFDC